jgi:hypothetical protein
MLDHSESFLAMEKSLREFYELTLKGRLEDAAKVLDEVSDDTARMTSAWLRSQK